MKQQLLVNLVFVLCTQRVFFNLVCLPEEGILYPLNLQSYQIKLVGTNIYHSRKALKPNQTRRMTVKKPLCQYVVRVGELNR